MHSNRGITLRRSRGVSRKPRGSRRSTRKNIRKRTVRINTRGRNTRRRITRRRTIRKNTREKNTRINTRKKNTRRNKSLSQSGGSEATYPPITVEYKTPQRRFGVIIREWVGTIEDEAVCRIAIWGDEEIKLEEMRMGRYTNKKLCKYLFRETLREVFEHSSKLKKFKVFVGGVTEERPRALNCYNSVLNEFGYIHTMNGKDAKSLDPTEYGNRYWVLYEGMGTSATDTVMGTVLGGAWGYLTGEDILPRELPE